MTPFSISTMTVDPLPQTPRRKAETRSDAHVDDSPPDDSDFEFEACPSDAEEPPLSPKLIHSPLWNEEQFFGREVPILHAAPSRSPPRLGRGHQLMDANLSIEEASAPSSSQLKDHQQMSGGRLGDILREAEAGRETSNVSLKEHKFRILDLEPSQHTARLHHSDEDLYPFRYFNGMLTESASVLQPSHHSARVHHADEDLYPPRYSDAMSKDLACLMGEEPATDKHGKRDVSKNCKIWAFKDFLHWNTRSKDHQIMTNQAEKRSPKANGSSSHRAATAIPASPQRSPQRSPRRPMSPHEAHYKLHRAQWEEMRKKTFLPYRQGLLGCLGGAAFGDLSNASAFQQQVW